MVILALDGTTSHWGPSHRIPPHRTPHAVRQDRVRDTTPVGHRSTSPFSTRAQRVFTKAPDPGSLGHVQPPTWRPRHPPRQDEVTRHRRNSSRSVGVDRGPRGAVRRKGSLSLKHLVNPSGIFGRSLETPSLRSPVSWTPPLSVRPTYAPPGPSSSLLGACLDESERVVSRTGNTYGNQCTDGISVSARQCPLGGPVPRRLCERPPWVPFPHPHLGVSNAAPTRTSNVSSGRRRRVPRPSVVPGSSLSDSANLIWWVPESNVEGPLLSCSTEDPPHPVLLPSDWSPRLN